MLLFLEDCDVIAKVASPIKMKVLFSIYTVKTSTGPECPFQAPFSQTFMAKRETFEANTEWKNFVRGKGNVKGGRSMKRGWGKRSNNQIEIAIKSH